MPIKPENRKRYPANWSEIRAGILERAKHTCEWPGCGRENYAWEQGAGKVIKIVLTIAHLDHTPENNDPSNLMAMCQRHHLAYDQKHHATNAYMTRKAKAQTLELPP